MVTDPTQRFSNRVENYVRFRPHYPRAVLELLRTECGLTNASVVADVGSGTGILSKMFLENGIRVFGVEPNREMRETGERLLADHPRFTSVAGTAEATTLMDGSVDFVTAGQAFHWFDHERARNEFERILKRGGWIAFLWNSRRRNATPFLTAYERLLRRHGTDYERVGYGQTGSADEVREFFAPDAFDLAVFDNSQTLDLDGFRGRLLSSSYVPGEGEPGADAMLRDAERIFHEHETDGAVTIEYDTKVYLGRLEEEGRGS